MSGKIFKDAMELIEPHLTGTAAEVSKGTVVIGTVKDDIHDIGKNIVITLLKGTPEEVRQEVRRVMETLGPGGGYMVASVHTIMNDVPAENIVAMVDAVDEFGRY